MPRPICVACQVEFVQHQTGVAVEHMAVIGSYQIQFADLFKCPGCGFEMISNFASSIHAEHFQPDYSETLRRLNARGTVFRSWANPEEKRQYEEAQEKQGGRG